MKTNYHLRHYALRAILGAVLTALVLPGLTLTSRAEGKDELIDLLFDLRKSKRMLRHRDFGPKLDAWRKESEHLSARASRRKFPINEGWLSIAPAWRGVQDSLRLPAFRYGFNRNEGMLSFYVDSVAELPTDSGLVFHPMKAFTDTLLRHVYRPISKEDQRRIRIVTRDHQGRMLIYRVLGVFFDNNFGYPEYMKSYDCYLGGARYPPVNPWSGQRLPNDATLEQLQEDRKAYQRLLKYGFIREDIYAYRVKRRLKEEAELQKAAQSAKAKQTP